LKLQKRFRYIFLFIVMIPLGSMLVSALIIFTTWNSRFDNSDELEAPRFLQPVLTAILTTDYDDDKIADRGIIFLVNHRGEIIYAHPELLKTYPEIIGGNWGDSGEDLYRVLMENMPSIPFSISVYRYMGEAGVAVYIPEMISPGLSVVNLGVKLVWIFYLGFILFPALAMNFFIRPMAKSLVGLENATVEIGRGNWDSPIELEGGNKHPFNHLLRSFEQMRVELKENHDRQSRIMMSISHDLKTPLTSIKGYVEALQDGMAQDPEDMARYTAIIMEKTNLLEERISDLIHFSRLNTTEWKNRFTSINLMEILTEAGSIFNNDALIRKRKMELKFTTPPDLEIMGDRRMLFQVLENLFDNACRYTNEGDSIKFSAKMLDEKILIAMEDSGPGIAEEHLPHIFDDFFRADSSRNTRGIGVGLASAKTIIQNHGGAIYYSKTKLGGAGFLIELPPLKNNPS
jgi:signal transduction histidine kinase